MFYGDEKGSTTNWKHTDSICRNGRMAALFGIILPWGTQKERYPRVLNRPHWCSFNSGLDSDEQHSQMHLPFRFASMLGNCLATSSQSSVRTNQNQDAADICSRSHWSAFAQDQAINALEQDVIQSIEHEHKTERGWAWKQKGEKCQSFE